MRPPDFFPELSVFLRDLLWKRGFQTKEAVRDFLNPNLSQVPSPVGRLLDLEPAIKILLKARDQKESVTIFGDYDVDGSTSAALLTSALGCLGWTVQTYIPHRVEEGYGLTTKAVDRLLQKFPETRVVVTCDCGVSSFAGVQALKDRGIKVIVTDHHEVPVERVAADAIINPKQKNCAYPEKNLAGVGVAFLLLMGIRRALERPDFSLRPYLDLVAVGTICDCAPLLGANRALVRAGLDLLQTPERPGLAAILRFARFDQRELRAKDVGFLIGPRLNASGRVGPPDLGFKTLMAPDRQRADELAKELESFNTKRRSMQEAQTEVALQMAEQSSKEFKHGLMIASPEFHLGIVGLMASRVSERWRLPTAVLTRVDDEHFLADYPGATGIWKGSLRAPAGFHLAQVLQRIQDECPGILLSFGGHAQAAGVTLKEESVQDFKQEFNKAIIELGQMAGETSYDVILEDPQEVAEALPLLEPLGQGNPPPFVLIRDFKLKRVQIMKEEHLKLWGEVKGRDFSVLHFRSPWVSLGREWEKGFGERSLSSGIFLSLIGEPQENEWNGRCTLEFQLRELLNWKTNGETYGIKSVSGADEIGKSSRL